ncbi:MAG: hypothetical protein ABTR92_11535 [Candidatus Accumulibacter phosphatis]
MTNRNSSSLALSAATTAPAALPTAAAGMLAGSNWRLLLVCLELALMLLIISRYQLESRTFFNVMALGCGGFVIHALLPMQYRLGFFVALSLTAIVVAFGLADGAWLISFGLLLIGICHLPWRLAVRVGLLLLTASLFALFRTEIVHGPWSVAIWPILGSMFMFRLALYLHALEHDEKRPTVARTLAYFFMLPNVCFPLFPVVDYLSFRRNYFDHDAVTIYETGIKWIVRGLIQLILYRYVYVFLTVDAMELNSLGDLLQFLLATFLLYLRVSGQFHLICGILYLFGFRLPETHHLYFLASSFTDFWRRINIYWKDFMMKLVYYPSFFWLKRFGANRALIGATIVVFAGTWLLHSYQWFWLRGSFPLEPQDGLFWGFLGALVVVGALREMKRSRPRKLGSAQTRWSFSLAWRVVATFSAICVLWSLWSAESLTTWLLMWSVASTTSTPQLLLIAATLVLALAIAGRPWENLDAGKAAASAGFGWKNLTPLLGLLLLLGLSARDWYAPLAPQLASTVAAVQRSTLNARDAALQQKGYYENLDNQSRMSAQLWEVTAQKPAHWVSLGGAGAYLDRDDFLRGEMPPNVSVLFADKMLTTNSWGMRDRERSLAKPSGVYRIAVLGPSLVMGSGVGDADTFTLMLEKRLNASDVAIPGRKVEVLNFGVAAYALTQQLATLDEKVFRFQPDAVIFTDTPRLATPTIGHLLATVAAHRKAPFAGLNRVLDDTGVSALGNDGIPVPFDFGRSLVGLAGVATRMPWVEAEQRLRRSADRVVQATLEEMARSVRSHGAVPVFLALDNVVAAPEHEPPVLRQAAAAGMLVFDLLDLWRGHNFPSLRIAAWDNHPNADGNRLAAERLTALVLQHAQDIGLEPMTGVADQAGREGAEPARKDDAGKL